MSTLDEMTTLDELYAQANGYLDKGEKSTENSLVLTLQARDIGMSTLDQLSQQGEEIKRMQTDIGTVNMNIDKSHRKMRSIESVFGAIGNSLVSARKKKPAAVKEKEKQDKKWAKAHKAQLAVSRPKRSTSLTTVMGRGRATCDAEEEIREKARRIDHNLDQIDGVLNDLHSIAVSMSSRLEEDNERLASLDKNLDHSNRRIERITNRCSDVVK